MNSFIKEREQVSPTAILAATLQEFHYQTTERTIGYSIVCDALAYLNHQYLEENGLDGGQA